MSEPNLPRLPTLDRLGVKEVPKDVDVTKIAQTWFDQFAQLIQSSTPEKVTELLLDDAFMRDMLALTWDFRSLRGHAAIARFLTERVAKLKFKPGSFKLQNAMLQRPFPDLVWIMAFFAFETDVAIGSGIFRLVPTVAGDDVVWKAHTVFTNLEDLQGFPEKVGALRNHAPNHGLWASQRKRELEFADGDPPVLIVGGGQSGLEAAARLKALSVNSIVVEKNKRVGDNWRGRYDALCLHDPVWYDHMPYLPFPPTWPVYTPALKLADWLESYAHSLEVNVWTGSTVTKAVQDPKTAKWRVTVERDGTPRDFVVNHLVFAVGIGGGAPKWPTYPGMDKFKGQIMHSSKHHHADDHKGKKVAIVGSCTSSHDISADYYKHGVDVTMIQRGPTYIMSITEGVPRLMGSTYWEGAPPTDVADRINASFPNNQFIEMSQRVVKSVADADKQILEDLKKVGFKLTMGEHDVGSTRMAWQRAGGYYLDVGASRLIADGKIKLKNDSPISHFSEDAIVFENGSELKTDVVIFATGFGDMRSVIRTICGDAIADSTKRIWGLNEEGEIYGAWRDVGPKNMWVMMGNLALCRFHSKHVALQIKAIEEGVFGPRYSRDA